MTDPTLPDEFGPDAEDELRAAEYVLGTLTHEERRAARDRAELDGAFAARIRAWEERLSPLDAGYDSAPAPDLLPQIEARLFGDAENASQIPSRKRWLGFGWRGLGLSGALAAALVTIAVLFWTPPPAPASLQAELIAEELDLQFVARWDPTAGLLELTRSQGDDAAEGQDYELWAIDESGVPRSLGLLRAPVTQLSTTLTPGITLAISLEPVGGSPEDVPTGPVLAAAPLREI